MIWVKHFMYGNFQVSIVPRRRDYSVVCIGYRSPRYTGWDRHTFDLYKYHVFDGTLSQCNEVFTDEVAFLCAMYDEEIYRIADVLKKGDNF